MRAGNVRARSQSHLYLKWLRSVEGNQENQIVPGQSVSQSVSPGQEKTFAFRPAKSEQMPGILSARAMMWREGDTLNCSIKMRAQTGRWSLLDAGGGGRHVVVLCCSTKTATSHQPSRAGEDENSHISVGWGERKHQRPLKGYKNTGGDSAMVTWLIQGNINPQSYRCLFVKTCWPGGTCTGQQDKQICWKYSSRRRDTAGPPAASPL